MLLAIALPGQVASAEVIQPAQILVSGSFSIISKVQDEFKRCGVRRMYLGVVKDRTVAPGSRKASIAVYSSTPNTVPHLGSCSTNALIKFRNSVSVRKLEMATD
jgi:hypothetical protein